jgi:transposase
MRTRVKNQLQALAMNEGVRWKKKLWSEKGRAQLESLSLAPWATRRRHDLLELLDRRDDKIEALTESIQKEAEKRPEVQLLMTHPGVGVLTALAFVLILGPWQRFGCGKQVGSYLGLIPSENSSGGHQRLGHITKQGNALLRWLLVEAVSSVIRYHPDWRRPFVHLALRREGHVARVALARKLAVRLYGMLRKGWDYEQMSQLVRTQGSPSSPMV